MNTLLQKGGLKLKFISFVIFAILIAISVQTVFAIPLIKSYIEKKAFEISTTTLERISEFSSFALLERTYENRLSLNDLIKKIRLSKIDGVVGVSIYQREKEDTQFDFSYLAGFGVKNTSEKKLLQNLDNSISNSVTYTDYTLTQNNKKLQTYRFIKPIMYTYQNQNILLGITILYYDKSTINSVVDEMIDLVTRITTGVLLLAILFVYFIGVRFTKPILQITKAAKDVSNGNLNINLNIKTNDEIQHLAEQFNKLVFSLQEHEKMQKFVSNSTMDMIQEDSTCQLILGGEHRTLTYLFCDIRDFTAMSEEKEPSEVISIVNFYLNLQSNIIKTNGGDIDKFIGDEVMASFCGENATKKALHAAIEIQKAIFKANQQRLQENLTVCEVGIGINQGEVIVGNVGSHERMDFTSIGLTVNLAARLCSFAKAGEILIEKNTYDKSGAECIVKTKAPIIAKGIKKELDTYSVIDLRC